MSLRGAPLLSWQRELGEAFGQVRDLLVVTGRQAGYVRCPYCACSHEVVPDGDGLIGVCRCEDHRGCPDMVFADEEELRVWDIYWCPFFIRLCREFILKWAEEEEQERGLVGWHGSGNTIPFFWFNTFTDSELARSLERMKGATYSGAVVLVPSRSALGPVSRALVEGKGIVVEGCDEVLELIDGGEVHALKTGEELVEEVLAWRGEVAAGAQEVREGVANIQMDMGTLIRNTEGMAKEIEDARQDAVGYVLDVKEQVDELLTPEQQTIWRAICNAGGDQSKALPAIVAAGYKMSLPTLCRRVAKIDPILVKARLPKCCAVGPKTRYKVMKKGRDEQDEVIAPEEVVSEEKWWEDESERQSTVNAYKKASEKEKRDLEIEYVKIKEMAEGKWKKRK